MFTPAKDYKKHYHTLNTFYMTIKNHNKNNPKSNPQKSHGDFAPVRYNGYLLDNDQNWSEVQKNNSAYAFFMDFLILNLKGIPNLTTSNFTIETCDYGTKTFAEKMIINYKNEKFATIVHSPRSEVLDAQLVQMQLENHLFYMHPLDELGQIVEGLIDELGLKFTGVNRLDLALDISNQTPFMLEVMKQLNAQNLRISGRNKKITYHYETIKGVQHLEGVSIGKRSTGRMLRIYDKTKENTKNLKTYILDAWGKLKINAQDVWRYEFQLGNRFLAKMKIDFYDLFDKDFLFNLFLESNNNHFTLKHNTGKTETNKEKDFIIFDVEFVRRSLNFLKRTITRIKRNIKETFIGQQRIVKGLMRSYFSSGQNSDYLTPIQSILDDFRLWSWYERKKPHYIKEFFQKGIFKTIDLDQLQTDLNVQL